MAGMKLLIAQYGPHKLISPLPEGVNPAISKTITRGGQTFTNDWFMFYVSPSDMAQVQIEKELSYAEAEAVAKELNVSIDKQE